MQLISMRINVSSTLEIRGTHAAFVHARLLIWDLLTDSWIQTRRVMRFLDV